MQDGDADKLRRSVRLLEEVLVVLDEQRLFVAAAHLDRCLSEIRRGLGLVQNGST